ncbi:hypothetical protein PRIC2_001459 [Phytophthora ramorum]
MRDMRSGLNLVAGSIDQRDIPDTPLHLLGRPIAGSEQAYPAGHFPQGAAPEFTENLPDIRDTEFRLQLNTNQLDKAGGSL